MKKIYLMVFVAFSIAISSCDNQAKQREIEKQRQEDSIRVAEIVKKELAESAEREKQEAEERTEKEAAERAERETITDNGSNNISEGCSEYIGKFRINGPDDIRQIITLREDKSVLLEVHYDFSNSDHKYLGVWRPYRSHYGNMICIDFTTDASLHIGRGFNPKQTTYYIYDMKIGMNYHDIPAHDEDGYSTITRM